MDREFLIDLFSDFADYAVLLVAEFNLLRLLAFAFFLPFCSTRSQINHVGNPYLNAANIGHWRIYE